MTAPLAKLTRIPPTVAAVADYEPLARERLAPQDWAYLDGGAADEFTAQDNRAAFSRWQLRTQVLRDLAGGGTGCELFGARLRYPILLAPVAYQKLAHPDGELATVLGASAMQAAMVVSTQASVTLEDIARAAQTPLWFQLYFQHDRGFTRDLARRAEGAGYRALVVSVDAPVSGLRNREQRAGFAFPPGVEPVNLRGLPPPPAAGAGDTLFGSPLIAAAPTWRDIDWLRAQTKLPVVLKGIMTAQDATRALAAGVDGVIVSNHGGRVLDTQPATIDVLPEIAAAIDGRMRLLMDGGIRRGSDVFKALALGADAVLIGRAFVHGLAAAGAPGVAHVLRILHAELEVTMALTGCRDLDAITPSLLRRSVA